MPSFVFIAINTNDQHSLKLSIKAFDRPLMHLETFILRVCFIHWEVFISEHIKGIDDPVYLSLCCPHFLVALLDAINLFLVEKLLADMLVNSCNSLIQQQSNLLQCLNVFRFSPRDIANCVYFLGLLYSLLKTYQKNNKPVGK